VPLLVAEPSTRRLQTLAAKDSAMLVWWGSQVECVSALARLERDGALSPQAITLALKRLGRLAAGRHGLKARNRAATVSSCAPAACR
jgi:hypothetical protein